MKQLFIIFFILSLFSIFHTSYGAGLPGYTPLTPIPGLTSNVVQTGTEDGRSSLGFAGYLKALYVWGVAAASGLAVVMIMWGGVEYMTSAGGGGVEEAKKRISSAIAGLLLALGSYVILYTINRDLLNLQFTIGKLNVEVNKNAAAKIIPQTIATGAVNGAVGGAVGGLVGSNNQNSNSQNQSSSASSGGLKPGQHFEGDIAPEDLEPVKANDQPGGGGSGKTGEVIDPSSMNNTSPSTPPRVNLTTPPPTPAPASQQYVRPTEDQLRNYTPTAPTTPVNFSANSQFGGSAQPLP